MATTTQDKLTKAEGLSLPELLQNFRSYLAPKVEKQNPPAKTRTTKARAKPSK